MEPMVALVKLAMELVAAKVIQFIPILLVRAVDFQLQALGIQLAKAAGIHTVGARMAGDLAPSS